MSKPELSEKFMIDEGRQDAAIPTEAFYAVDSDAVLRTAEVIRGVGEGVVTYDRGRFGKGVLLLPIWTEGDMWRIEPPEVKPFRSDDTHEWDGSSNMLENRSAVAAYDLDQVDGLQVGGGAVYFERDSYDPNTWRVTHTEQTPAGYFERLYRAIGSGAIYEPGFGRTIQYSDSNN